MSIFTLPGLSEALVRIAEALVSGDNEMTESPYWFVYDPGRISWKEKRMNPYSVMEGPFFSRADAESWLEEDRHNHTHEATVACASGWRSEKYRALCTVLKIGQSKERK